MATSPVAGTPNPSVVAAAESPAAQHIEWATPVQRFGVAGVNLAKAIEALSPNELARLTNGITKDTGGIAARFGATAFAFAGTNIHSCHRLNDPNDGTYTLFWGVDQNLERGQAGALNNILGGFSGKPLSFAPWESEYSGEPWMFVADASRMAKASRTSPALPIGLPKASQPSSITPAVALITPIAAFNSSDGSEAASWSPISGVDTEGNASGAPVIYDATGISGGAVNLALVEGAATTSYYSGMSLARALDLSVLPGPVTSDDEDLIHFALRINTPNEVSEVRLYFVVDTFTDAKIPGTEPGFNSSAYVRAFRSSDFSEFVVQTSTALSSESAQRSARILALAKASAIQGKARAGLARALANEQKKQLDAEAIAQRNQTAQAAFDPPTEGAADVVSSGTLAGSDVWTSYGVIGLPLRKSDFLKIGNAGDPGLTWANVTGIVITVITKHAVPITLGFCEAWLTGGYDPDTSEPDAQKYDYRICNLDTRTGARSNPSDVLAETSWIDTARQQVLVQPIAYGDPNIIQEAYRRGGALTDNWYGPVAVNTADGGLITDEMSDISAIAAGSVEIDHDQPVTTTDEAGNAVYGEPLSFLFGPIDGVMLGGGDRYRPGDLYYSKQASPDYWPAFNHQQACPPSEILMNGDKYGGQGFVFSRERMYGVVVAPDGSISTNPTDCANGLAGRMGLAVGPGGIFFVSRDAVRVTLGGASKTLSDPIRPLFQPPAPGMPTRGYYPIDFTAPDALKLAVYGDDLWFGFKDTAGSYVWWVYSIIYQTWRCVLFAVAVNLAYSNPRVDGGLQLILGGVANGQAGFYEGGQDFGLDFSVEARTGALLGNAREEKLLGDVVVWGDLQGAELTMQTFLNNESVTNSAIPTTAATGPTRYIYNPFGTQPQHAQNISLDLSWDAGSAIPGVVEQYGISTAIQPEITMQRATTWQPLNNDGEAYVTGCWIDCDTGGADVDLVIEGLLNGTLVTLDTFTINSYAGRRKWESWPAQHADMIRLRPTGECAPWMLFGQGWLTCPEPPRIAGWDTGFETFGDTYYTGLDLEVDTLGAAKQIIVEVDGVVLNDPATGFAYWTITANGRRYLHLTLPWGRGHVYRAYSTDTTLGLLYSHKWLLDQEPGEQANWNQNFTIAGTKADKWLKGILLECDTFGNTKLVNVEVDGVAHSDGPFFANATGRKVIQIAFPQRLGRVFRIFPADHFPGRLYSNGWIFDQEPLQLTRFETQEITFSIQDWKLAVYGQITYKSIDTVTVNLLTYGMDGDLLGNDNYTFPDTAGLKVMRPLKPQARKGLMYKAIVTAANGFWLYREESWIRFQSWGAWGAEGVQIVHPFGSDDLDTARPMRTSELTAAREGGAVDAG